MTYDPNGPQVECRSDCSSSKTPPFCDGSCLETDKNENGIKVKIDPADKSIYVEKEWRF